VVSLGHIIDSRNGTSTATWMNSVFDGIIDEQAMENVWFSLCARALENV
jgi:hypothetical protein